MPVTTINKAFLVPKPERGYRHLNSVRAQPLNMAQTGIPCTPAETHGTHNNQHNTEIPANIRNSGIGQGEKSEKRHCFRGGWLQKLLTETQ